MLPGHAVVPGDGRWFRENVTMHLASTLTDMFALHLPILEKAVRPVIVYLFLVAAFRVAGKRELLQFTTFDFVLLLMLSNTVQNAIIGDDNSVTGGLIGAAVLLTFNAGLARLLYSVPGINRLVVGDATTLIENGEIRPEALRRLRITRSELIALIRRQNFDSIRAVQSAEVEPTGSVVMKGFHPSAEDRNVAEILERLARIEVAIERMSSGTGTPATTPPTPGTRA